MLAYNTHKNGAQDHEDRATLIPEKRRGTSPEKTLIKIGFCFPDHGLTKGYFFGNNLFSQTRLAKEDYIIKDSANEFLDQLSSYKSFTGLCFDINPGQH